MSKQKRRSDCPINFALELFGDRWTFLIVRDMMFKGKHYYGEFLQSEENIATNILADRLLLLENDGIIIKNRDPMHGSKNIYRLTHKGIALVPVLVEIILWSSKYDKHAATDPRFVRSVKRNKENVINDICTRLIAELTA